MNSAATNVNWAGAAGNATLAFAGRWIGRGLVYAFHHPLSTGMSLVLGFGITLGAINAMFLQTARHPAPLFMETASIAHPVTHDTPAIEAPKQAIPTPLMRPVNLNVAPVPVVAAPRTVTIPDNVGNKDVAELQARLTELGFFSGKIDGYYGPMTADAIRRFETEAGLTPIGAVSVDVLAAAKAYVPLPKPQAAATATPRPVVPTLTMPGPRTPEPTATAPAVDPIGQIAAGLEENQTTIVAVAAEPAAEAPARKPDNINPELVRMVQTGLSRLGFLHGEISAKFDAETARAIREFENYNNFSVTGELTPDLIDVLMDAGAFQLDALRSACRAASALCLGGFVRKAGFRGFLGHASSHVPIAIRSLVCRFLAPTQRPRRGRRGGAQGRSDRRAGLDRG